MRLMFGITVLCVLASSNLAAQENSAGRTTTGEVGDALQIAIPAISLASSLIKKDWQGSKQFSYGLVTTLAVTYGLKETISKQRPDGRDDDSFPSGHTAVSMHAATYLQQRYGWRYGLPAYIAATYVGFSRVHDERHDEQDIIVGALLGYAAGRLFTSKYRGLDVLPLVGEDVVGISIRLRH